MSHLYKKNFFKFLDKNVSRLLLNKNMVSEKKKNAQGRIFHPPYWLFPPPNISIWNFYVRKSKTDLSLIHFKGDINNKYRGIVKA